MQLQLLPPEQNVLVREAVVRCRFSSFDLLDNQLYDNWFLLWNAPFLFNVQWQAW